MDSRNHERMDGSRGESSESADERRYGEEAHAYQADRRGDRGQQDAGRVGQPGGMAASSATTGLGTESGMDSAYGSAGEGTQQIGGTGSADHGSMGTVNAGGGAGLSSGNATADETEPPTATDSAWQRKRGGMS